jgi:hypothetical protein
VIFVEEVEGGGGIRGRARVGERVRASKERASKERASKERVSNRK